MAIITPIAPTPCSSIETVLRNITEASVKFVSVNDQDLNIIVVADLIDVGPIPDVVCTTVTFYFTGATRAAALAALASGPTTGDAVIQIGVDLVVDFFDGSIPADEVQAIGLDIRATIEQLIAQALRNGLGGAV